MEQFSGFPARMQFTPLPNLFYSRILPEISDITELKATLYLLPALLRQKGYPRFVPFSKLAGNSSLMNGLKGEDELHRALALAVKRGTFLHLSMDRENNTEDIYLLNTVADRVALAGIRSGELTLSGLQIRTESETEAGELPDIFTLYEQNLGMLTPMMAEELQAAEKLYPEAWIIEAVKEAVRANKRKWSYVAAILERWSTEGRSDGTYQRDSKTDPDKYIKGQYGHMVRR